MISSSWEFLCVAWTRPEPAEEAAGSAGTDGWSVAPFNLHEKELFRARGERISLRERGLADTCFCSPWTQISIFMFRTNCRNPSVINEEWRVQNQTLLHHFISGCPTKMHATLFRFPGMIFTVSHKVSVKSPRNVERLEGVNPCLSGWRLMWLIW